MPKPLLAALLLIFVLARMAQGPATAESGIQGNVDCDATINAIDARHVLRHSVGLSTTASVHGAASGPRSGLSLTLLT